MVSPYQQKSPGWVPGWDIILSEWWDYMHVYKLNEIQMDCFGRSTTLH
jgi:hypothetical protein